MPHPLRSGSMAQHQAIAARHGNSPATPPSPNIEQLVRGGEAMRWQPPHSSIKEQQHQEMEFEHTPQQKKSVLAKVKEKAKKWGRSLSKKKHNDDHSTTTNNNNTNTTPSWGVSLDDYEDDDEPESSLGAPMYESEMASGGYKATVRPKEQHHHHPGRLSTPLVFEKQVSSGNANNDYYRRNKSPMSKTHTAESIAAGKQPQVSPMTLAETLGESPAPPPSSQPQSHDPTNIISPKVQNLSVSTSPPQASRGTKAELLQAPGPSSSSSSSFSAATAGTLTKAATPSSAPATVTWKHPPAAITTSPSSFSSTVPKQAEPGPLKLEEAAPPPVATKPAEPVATTEQSKAYSAPAPGEGAALGRSNSEQIWDKGVSVKEYIMNKLEPGEDAKALSQVISQVMSPRKAPGDAGVVEKVKEAVSSLWQEDSSQSASESASQSNPSYRPAHNTPSSPHIPISTNSTEVEEENQGRILQAN